MTGENSMMPHLVMDMRCLQDAGHGERGIAVHAASLARQARRAMPGTRLIGVIDSREPALAAELAAAVDEIRPNFYLPELPAGSLFVNLWAMGPGQAAAARLLRDPRIAPAAVVYDFIPLDEPGYLAAPATRIEYTLARCWLDAYRLFLPISAPVAGRLAELAPGVPCVVTGVGISLFDGERQAALAPRHLLMVGGDDKRKNPEALIRAHAGSAVLQGLRVPLVITGTYPAARREAFQRLAAATKGDPALLELPGRLPAADLRAAYRQAFAVITPSRAEGFSLPVVEAMAAGVPSVASNIPAHAALLANPDWRFGVENVAELAAICARMVTDGDARGAIIAAQTPLWLAYRAEKVAEKFWSAVAALAPAAPAIIRGQRPRIALLSPLPPARTGIADFSAALLAALRRRAEVTPIAPDPASGTVPLWNLAHLSPRYDRVVSTLGNSARFHGRIYDLLRRHGGACICHDSRLMGLVLTRQGAAATAAMAARALGRPVGEDEIANWARDERGRETGFFGEIAAAARPLIFHDRHSVAEVAAQFGVTAAHLPFAVYRPWDAPGDATAARARLGWSGDETIIVSFGFAEPFKGVEPAIRALALLREVGGNWRLFWAGQVGEEAGKFMALAAALGVGGRVHFRQDYMDEAAYRDHLLAADFGLQLRIGPPGNVSGALQDCIAAGLPSVANDDLAATIEAPDYVRRVGDALDPAAICGAFLAMVKAGAARADTEPARQAYCRSHSMEVYADRLMELLGLH